MITKTKETTMKNKNTKMYGKTTTTTETIKKNTKTTKT